MAVDAFYFKAGALFGALGVALGAFGAHSLRARVGEQQVCNSNQVETFLFQTNDARMLEIWDTGAR